MTETPSVVLTIAGFDPSGGAGVLADVKVIAAHYCYGVACITALTVQSTTGVRRVSPVAAGLVRETLEELATDLEIAAVHIGMLGSGTVAAAVADFLAERKLRNIVLDPVLKSSSGAELLDAEGVKLLRERLLPLAAVMTPNVDEAEVLTGTAVANPEQMLAAAWLLHEMGAAAVVVTGGHLDRAVDLLSIARPSAEAQVKTFATPRLRSNSTHGTGCAFSTALACQLAKGIGLAKAVPLAKNYVTQSIKNAYPVGRGIGPVNHLWRGFGGKAKK